MNPDLDGVASAMAYAHLKHNSGVVAAYWGKLNAQTRYALNSLKIGQSIVELTQIPVGSFVLVDTHHENQLPENFPLADVTEIIDHHPSGEPEKFPNARIQNEQVGAAATLVAERFLGEGIDLPIGIAALLALGILSNTINFAAPSTTSRDEKAFEWLKGYFDFVDSMVEELFRQSADIDSMQSLECLVEDLKIYSFGGTRIGISQLEAVSIEKLLNRHDFAQEVVDFAGENGLDHFVFNGVDVVQRKSYLQLGSKATSEVMGKIIGFPGGDLCIHLPRIVLRKTDLVGQLKAYFSSK